MSDVVISIENLWKEYRFGVISHQTLSRDLQSWWARMRGKEDPNAPLGTGVAGNVADARFWALQDVCLEVKRGEVLGIIGRNGAGKSTLLKILSQVTAPSRGVVRFRGRMASLLEVGTGFHPELTGRENIFLNGAILGMCKAEIRVKLDEIISFAEIEKFIDTPVKRYSSGMYVRLAFAVAAHLEPEILVVDEVLAVGDAQFQKKCLGKMEAVGREGRTVLFVSHNMQAISHLCSSAIVLRSGKIVCKDNPGEVVVEYLRDGVSLDGTASLAQIIMDLPSDPVFRLMDIELSQQGRTCGAIVENGRPLEVEIHYRVQQPTSGLRVYFDLCDDQGTLLFRSFNDEQSDGIPLVNSGIYRAKTAIPANLLGPVSYDIRVRAGIFNVRSCLPGDGVRLPIKVEQTGSYNKAYLGDTFRGKLALVVDWRTERIADIG